MSYKILILSASCGGKSTLTRYLRANTKLNIAETDEEVMNANNGIWPDDELKNKVLVPLTTKKIIDSKESVIYFASYVPYVLIIKARQAGFVIIILEVDLASLEARNNERMKIEGYASASPWFKMQLDTYRDLKKLGLIDLIIDGSKPTKQIANSIKRLTQ